MLGRLIGCMLIVQLALQPWRTALTVSRRSRCISVAICLTTFHIQGKYCTLILVTYVYFMDTGMTKVNTAPMTQVMQIMYAAQQTLDAVFTD